MSWKRAVALKKLNRGAFAAWLEPLEPRRFLTASCQIVGGSTMTIFGNDGNVGNSISFDYNSGTGALTAKDGGTNLTNCISQTGITGVVVWGGSSSTATSTGNDIIDAGSVPNGIPTTLMGQDGGDTISGGGDIASIRGGDGNDYVTGGALGDLLYGDDGVDTMDGSGGGDSMWGGLGDDSMGGNAGNDYMLGEDGLDSLWGQAGNDSLFGGANADRLEGGSGNDYLDGGGDSDSFIVLDSEADTIDGGLNDFVVDNSDGTEFLDTFIHWP